MLPMVNWFDIGQLADTGIKVVLSSIFGTRSDSRLVQAIAAGRIRIFDYTFHYNDINDEPLIDESKPRDDIWIDYIADTGDGWNSTYAVAYHSSQETLELKFNSERINTRRGDLLIFGGDMIYPTPSRRNYDERLVTPFAAALGKVKNGTRPHLFAVPGNHDWYDGLNAFSRLFCSDLNRNFGDWFTRQKRSYFALKLPHNWWLLGSDGQLESDLDTPQIEYFRYIAENEMNSGDKVILCTAAPEWIMAEKYKKLDETIDESDLIYIQNEILGNKNIEIKAFIAGDYHYYKRHEEISQDNTESKVQKIVAGGGGAFLHPTHGFDDSILTEQNPDSPEKPRKFKLKMSYPDKEKSKQLTWQNLFFFFKNPGFGLVTGILYFFTAWMVSASIGFRKPNNIIQSFDFTIDAFITNPFAALWIAIVFAAFIIFNDTHSKLYKWIGGLTHCFFHFVMIFWIGSLSFFLANIISGNSDFLLFLFTMLMIFGGGWLAGSLIMGVYLLISMNVFGRHDNEAFSALKIQDYKNFLRLKIDNTGQLTIFPIKIETVPRHWKESNSDSGSLIVPTDGSKPELIEEPIVLK